MAAHIINGKEIVASVREGIAAEVEGLKEQGIHPGLAVVIVGDDPASHVYVNNKEKKRASRQASIPKSTVCPKRRPRKNCFS